MCLYPRRCRAWISLDSAGIPVQGCLRDSTWLRQIDVPQHHSIMNPSLYLDLPSKKITCMKTMSHGSFGYIDLALEKTTEGTNEVYVKRPILPGKSLLYEACIQKWVAEELSTIGFSTGAPQITHIFMLRDHSICFSMKPIEGAMTLDRYLESVSTAHLSNVIIDCLFQLCGMLWHLNHIIGMNHRDIKPSNFLIVVKEQPETKIIVVEHELIELQSSHSLTLIDFGFSCIGSIETQHTELSLSTVYPKDDPCPKEGRDLYLFLGLLYIDYYHQLAPRLRILFESWLQEPGSRLCTFMRKDKEHSKKWLYFMAGNEQIKRFYSTPQRIVYDLQAFR